jgi:hypothetical protein
VLPGPVRSCVVLGGLDAWDEALAEAGVDRGAGAHPDLVVAPDSAVEAALRTGAAAVLLEGPAGAAALRRAGLHVRRYVSRPTRADPSVLLGLDQPRAAAAAVRLWTTSDRRWRQARNALAAAGLRAGVAPAVGPVTLAGVRTAGPPRILAAAEAHGIPAGSQWFLTSGRGDQLSRNAFHVLTPGASRPGWIVKFARVAGYADPFDRDEHGLALARDGGPLVTAHAPRLLARLVVDGRHVSIETAAPGMRLTRLLREPGNRARKLAVVDDIAAWTVGMGAATARPDALGPELRRLEEEVLPHWTAAGVPGDLARRLPDGPAVLQHNDLGTWNVVADGREFTAVDWESARPAGLPLWDLAYFLTDALARLDGISHDDQDGYAARLYRGELERSPTLFGWIRRAVAAAGIAPEAVGTILGLCWLHHGTSHVRRSAAMDRHAPARGARVPALERMARLWFTDPALGPGWSAWRP